MPIEQRAVFLADLLQDVNILRPLMGLASRDLRLPVIILMSHKFVERDVHGIWREEVEEIAQELGARKHVFGTEWEAYRFLEGGRGALISASETDLAAHSVNHGVFRTAPSSYLRMTVQHGFECVGFSQNREHNLAHGRNVTFGADVICAWTDVSRLRAMPASQRSKVYVTGPPAVLQHSDHSAAAPAARAARLGLVCENLHSVRFRISGNFQLSFMDIFFSFCQEMLDAVEKVTLRPHPAGQYFEKQNIPIPENVLVENRPAYKVNFAQYAYGISAPSSVLIDMLLAGIPVAVWQDSGGVMDISNYAGLVTVSGVEDWLAFRRDVAVRPEMLLLRQAHFLQRTGMPTDPQDVRCRFLRLIANA